VWIDGVTAFFAEETTKKTDWTAAKHRTLEALFASNLGRRGALRLPFLTFFYTPNGFAQHMGNGTQEAKKEHKRHK